MNVMSEQAMKNPVGTLIAALEAVMNKYGVETGLSVTDLIGALELLKHQMLSEARDGYKEQIHTEEIRKEANYFG